MEKVYSIIMPGGSKVETTVRGFKISTDQPIKAGGENSAPSPFELFLASIGTCAGYYVAAFCQARGIPTVDIGFTQTMLRNESTHLVEKIQLELSLPPGFPEKYRDAVVKAAEACTVKKHLAAPPAISVSIAA
jgi:putative redox protein